MEPSPPLDPSRPRGSAGPRVGGAAIFRILDRWRGALAAPCAAAPVDADRAIVARRARAVSATRTAPMSGAIVDYGSGNLHSAAKAFERAARESGHDQPIAVTRDPEDVRRAERIVLPGVGAFADCRRGLDAVPGMIEALVETVRGKGRPFLGICV